MDGSVPVDCTPPSLGVFPIGLTAVTCSASDAAGNEASASFGVAVRGPNEQLARLIAEVQGLGPGRSLARILQNAEASLERDDPQAACHLLGAFANEATSQSGMSVPAGQAAALVDAAGRIRAVLSC